MPQSAVRTALAGLIGNVLEWFDFAVYGYFASDIGRQFFPSTSETAQRILAFAVFAIGFIARPVGSVVLGRVGDRIGRRALLTISIALMGGSTLAIGLLPTYASAGAIAPILLVLMRMIQGFSLGGEFTGSMVYTTELASPLARGLISSSTAAGTTLGFILGSACGYGVRAALPDADVAAWGWRIPFIVSISFCIAGYFLRHNIIEPTEGEKAKAERAHWLRSLVRDRTPVLQTFGIVAMTNAAYYLTFTFVVDLHTADKLSAYAKGDFLAANTLVLVLVLFAKPLGGLISDRIGRRRLMLLLTVAMLVVIIPGFALMREDDPVLFGAGQAMLGLPLGMALGCQGAMLVEIFPLRSRVTSMSIAYSVTLALAGGLAPLVSTYLAERLHHPTWPGFYIMLYGVAGLAIMLPMRETNERALDD